MAHSGVYSTGLTVDGDDWTRTDGRIFARITSGIWDSLEVRGQDVTIPGRDGQVALNRKAHQRFIAAEGMVMGAGATEALARTDFLALRAMIFGKMRGDQDPYSIVAVLEDGSTATISARPLYVEWGEERIPSYREFIARWIATGDPENDLLPDWDLSGGGS